MKKLLNGQLVDMTNEEIAQKETDEANALVEKQELKNAEADKETKSASGKQKLLDLGLSEEEVKALIGV
jgi:hypothetical protein